MNVAPSGATCPCTSFVKTRCKRARSWPGGSVGVCTWVCARTPTPAASPTTAASPAATDAMELRLKKTSSALCASLVQRRIPAHDAARFLRRECRRRLLRALDPDLVAPAVGHERYIVLAAVVAAHTVVPRPPQAARLVDGIDVCADAQELRRRGRDRAFEFPRR